MVWTFLAAALLPAQNKSPWDPLEFLLGTWTANTSDSHGATTFKLDLTQHIILRTNFAEYTKGPQPARATTI